MPTPDRSPRGADLRQRRLALQVRSARQRLQLHDAAARLAAELGPPLARTWSLGRGLWRLRAAARALLADRPGWLLAAGLLLLARRRRRRADTAPAPGGDGLWRWVSRASALAGLARSLQPWLGPWLNAWWAQRRSPPWQR